MLRFWEIGGKCFTLTYQIPSKWFLFCTTCYFVAFDIQIRCTSSERGGVVVRFLEIGVYCLR
jgi:hypothetical protein